MSNHPDFCHIRMISDRQVLAYTQCDNDELALHILFRYGNGTNVDMAVKFDDDEDGPAQSLAGFIAGDLDAMICKQIATCERDLPTVKDEG